MTKRAKSTDGVFWKRGDANQLVYYWRVGNNKSKDFLDKRACAEEFIQKYIERNPKYEPLCEGKTWEECFRMFNIVISER